MQKFFWLLLTLFLVSCSKDAPPQIEDKNVTYQEADKITPIEDEIEYTLIEVYGGDLSGHREPNVVVDIGFGDREYYAYTNEFGQLVKVYAKEIILQDEENDSYIFKNTGQSGSSSVLRPG